ncbi:hypothetical protein ACU4GR_00410 [Methylobacterium oryzae CBMB20]
MPEHDPWRFDAARQVAAGEADAVLWLGAVPVSRPDWLVDRAVRARSSPTARRGAAEVVIAVGQPGRDHGGVLWNEQRAALTYLAGLRRRRIGRRPRRCWAPCKARLIAGQAVSRSEPAC